MIGEESVVVYHDANSGEDEDVSVLELRGHLDRWLVGEVPLGEVLEAVGAWREN